MSAVEIRRPKAEGRKKVEGRNPKRTAQRCLLLGLGNDLLCDDAIGLRVAAAIRERLAEDEKVSAAETPEMGLALLDLVTGFDELILVDAVQTHQAPPGFVYELEAAELKVLPTISPHFLGIGEVMALGRELGLPVPNRIQIFAIEVEDPFSVTTQMTPTLEASLPGIVERILQFLGKRRSEPSAVQGS